MAALVRQITTEDLAQARRTRVVIGVGMPALELFRRSQLFPGRWSRPKWAAELGIGSNSPGIEDHSVRKGPRFESGVGSTFNSNDGGPGLLAEHLSTFFAEPN